MSFVVYIVVAVIISLVCAKEGTPITFSDADCIVLAILAGAEVISWRCRK